MPRRAPRAEAPQSRNAGPVALRVRMLQAIKEAEGCTCAEAKAKGYSLLEIKAAGYSLQEMKAAGYSNREINKANREAMIAAAEANKPAVTTVEGVALSDASTAGMTTTSGVVVTGATIRTDSRPIAASM